MSEAVQASDDLYAKIALDNKLVTQFQLEKAEKRRGGDSGKAPPISLGEALLALGYLSDRQNQSILNACHYRVQRDQDKRFARQVLRMDLLTQDQLEGALDEQKDTYARTGQVKLLVDVLTDSGILSPEEAAAVAEGLAKRDRLRRSGQGHSPLRASGAAATIPPKYASQPEPDDADLDDADLDDADLDDLDDADLDDLDDAGLDDLDLDDLDDADLDDADLDDLEDLDLDDADLDDLEDLDLDDVDADLDDIDAELDAIEGELQAQDGDPADLAPPPPADVADELDAIGDIDLGSALDPNAPGLEALDEDLDDERELARQASELDSEVELNASDLEALEDLTGGGRPDEPPGGWAAEAFDDRPISHRMPAAAPAPPPPAPPAPIPGGDVFDDDLSGEAPMVASDVEPSGERLGRISEVGGVSDSVVTWGEDGDDDSASGTGSANAGWRDDPRLRAAFEKALAAAWDVFVAELRAAEPRQ